MGFQDSALLFELWVWVESNQLGIQDEILSSLYFIVEYQFRANHIEIPFPQHDLWIKNLQDFPALGSRFKMRKEFERSISHSQDVNSLEESLSKKNAELSKSSHEPRISIRNSLKKVGSFSHLNELRLRQIIEIGSLKSLKTDEVLFRENDPGDAFYIVLSGSVEVYAESLGKQLAMLKPGNFFGEMSLMLGIPRTATIRALESTLLFAIVHSKFKVLLQRYPDFQETIAEELSNHQEELILRKQELQAMGLLTQEEQETNIVNWISQRLQTIFGL
jgi:CRP-like cAMP-binding protein